MPQYNASNLIVHPGTARDPDVVVEVTPELAGWDYIHFQVRRLRAGGTWSFETGEHELALVSLSGTFSVESNRGQWRAIGSRANVFAGPPHALYLPRHTTLMVSTADSAEFAAAWVVTDQDHAPRLVTPADLT